MADVARVAEVDASTASRVLRHDPAQIAREEARQRIVRAAELLGYRPDASAVSLVTKRTKIIGLIVPDLDNVGWSEIIHGVEAAAAAEGYLVLLVDAHAVRRIEDVYERLIMEDRVDGLLISFAYLDEAPGVELAQRNLPVVLLNRRTAWAQASVTANDERASELAVNYLALLGHRRIGYIGGVPSTDTARRRENGFLGAMAALGLPVNPLWMGVGNYTEAGGRTAAAQIMAADDRPSALYVANLMSALGVLSTLHDVGTQVPHELSIVAMDDHPFAAYSSPPLTTVAMPFFKMGDLAVRSLLRAINGENVGHVMIQDEPRIIERESSGPVDADWIVGGNAIPSSARLDPTSSATTSDSRKPRPSRATS